MHKDAKNFLVKRNQIDKKINKSSTIITKSFEDETEDFFLIRHCDDDNVILGTKFLLTKLFSSKKIMVDGTFKIAPKDYRQVYIFWAVVEECANEEDIERCKAFPCIYLILKSKLKEEYMKSFQEVEKYR